MLLNEYILIKNNIKNLRVLNEWVNRNDVVDAINNNDVVYIYYAGDNTINRGFRTIEPYCLGIHKKTGNLVLRAYQQAGASDTKRNATREADKIPNWRLFRLDGITSFMKTFKKFDSTNPRPKYNPNDSDMSKIFAAVNSDDRDIFKLTGVESIDEPDSIIKQKSFFDKQTGEFRKFASPNEELQFKKNISDLFGLVKYNRKQNPLNYIVVNKNGKLWYDLAKNQKKYKPDDIIGNLDTLYRENLKLEPKQRLSKDFFRKQYDEFEKSIRNQ